MKILLTRHGQTDWNVLGKIQGQTDIELNETGIKQAETTREKLLDYDIDLILTSPLKRAKKTAEIIGKDRNIPIKVEDRLVERKFGAFEGKTRQEFNLDEIWDYKLDKQYENMESVKQVCNRINTFLSNLKKTYSDKTILLVTHGGVCIPIRAYFEGIPENNILAQFQFDNCEVKEYEL